MTRCTTTQVTSNTTSISMTKTGAAGATQTFWQAFLLAHSMQQEPNRTLIISARAQVAQHPDDLLPPG